jgi:peptidoglycan-associated lipoprotein
MKILSLFASALLVSACATEPEDTGSAEGSGSSAQSQAAAAPGSSAPAKTAPAPTKAMPSGAPPGSGVDFYINVGDRVFFDFDKSEIKPKAAETLKRQAAWLNKYKSRTVVIEGHCDERGTREYNLALGERRANAAREYLISLGVDPARIETISYGKERPAVLGSNESAWAQNRRAVTLVRGGEGS